MRKITFDNPVLKVEGLETKFDVVPVSNSLAIVIGNRDLATIVQQLSYWTLQGYGEVIDGVRWFYKPIKEWIAEVFPTFTPYQLGKMMKQLSDRGIIRREKLFTKHQIQNGDRFWWQPKNQTYYYSLNTEKIQELADNFQVPKTSKNPGTSVFIKTQILSNEEIKDTKDFDCSKNNTENTSIENNSRDLSLPHLPCECEAKEIESDQEQEFVNPVLLEVEKTDFVNPKAIEQDTNIGRVEKNINQYKNTNKKTRPETDELQKTDRPSPKLKVTPTKQKRENKAPWQDETERSQFYRALIQALPIVANSHSPQGLAKTIIAQLKRGEEHTYWDDFKAGLPIGTSTKPEWEVEPGVTYPMFVEYLIEKIRKGNNTQTIEQARDEAYRILSKPRQAKDFWGQFKRSVVNISEQVERDRALGVSNPNTPVWTRERIEPSIKEAAVAGKKIMAVNGSTQAVIESADALANLPTDSDLKSSKEARSGFPTMSRSCSSQVAVHSASLGQTLKLESKDSPSASLSKSEGVFSPPDPWSDRPKDTHCDRDERQPTMRKMLAERGVKGFAKSMPKVSQAEVEADEREHSKPKTNIDQMTVEEINEYIKDPVLHSELYPQLRNSDYELSLDYLGQIIKVELSDIQIRSRRRLDEESS